MKNNKELYEIVVDRIINSSESKITFADYMEFVLYHPEYGYYSSGIVDVGSSGDFFTSSSLGKYFGELLSSQLFEMWKNLGSPDSFSIVEMGAGNGNLAKDILGFIALNYCDFARSLNYIIVEKSPKLIKKQKEVLESLDNFNISWRSELEILDRSIVGCFLANELVDAFPVHKVRVSNGDLLEVYVGEESGKLIEKSDRVSSKKIENYFKLVGVDILKSDYPENYYTEVNIAAIDWLNFVGDKLERGYLLTIDYGYLADKYYHPQRSEGTLKCYYKHRHHNNPYINLGHQDITCHVDFTALQNFGRQYDLETILLTKQGLYLMALGLGERLSELSSGKYNIEEIMQGRDYLHQLINPLGLGGFYVLIQGKNLTEEQYNFSCLSSLYIEH